MDTTKRLVRIVLATMATFGSGLALLPGCNTPADDSPQSESAQGVTTPSAVIAAPGAPSTLASPGPAPSALLARYQAHSPPPLATAAHVSAFLDWAAASHVDEKDDVRQAIGAAAGNEAVVRGLIAEVERTQGVDHSRALIALGVLGETRHPLAQAFFADFISRPLPQTGTVIEGEIIEQTQAAQLQGRAAVGLAFINSDSANKLLAQIIASHPSKIVRAEAINAYLWNHGDSAAARVALAPFVRTDEQILLDRVRRVPGETAASFNAKLVQFLKLHPEAIPPAPVRSQSGTKPTAP